MDFREKCTCYLISSCSDAPKLINSRIITIIIIDLFIEGSLISTKALFCLRALFGATWIPS